MTEVLRIPRRAYWGSALLLVFANGLLLFVYTDVKGISLPTLEELMGFGVMWSVAMVLPGVWTYSVWGPRITLSSDSITSSWRFLRKRTIRFADIREVTGEGLLGGGSFYQRKWVILPKNPRAHTVYVTQVLLWGPTARRKIVEAIQRARPDLKDLPDWRQGFRYALGTRTDTSSTSKRAKP